MTALFPDTDRQTEEVLIELLRAAPPWRKLEMLGEMYEASRLLAMAGLRARYPQATEAQLRRHLADLLLGPELALKAYGPHVTEASDVA